MSGKDFSVDGPITWDAFMQMPREAQETLLRYVTTRFHVGTTMVAQDLFHISRHTLYRYIQANRLEFPMSQGGRMPEALHRDWKKWVSSVTSAGRSASVDATAAESPGGTSVDGTANAVGDVVRSMHDLYGRIRVTIVIEPT